MHPVQFVPILRQQVQGNAGGARMQKSNYGA